MRNLIQLCVAAVFLALVSQASAAPPSKPNSPMQTPQQMKVKKSLTVEANYLLFLPKNYKTGGKLWPLILFLHGAGERGTDIWKVAVHGPPKHIATHPEFPFVVVSPQCPNGQIWSNDTLLALLDEVTRNYSVDTTRIYLTGLSMGGYGTWKLGLSYPEKFAAIIPICGGGELITILLASGEKSEALKSLGVWAFHGAKDPVVPLSESERMADLLKKAGAADVQLTVYPEAGHDSWTETYNNPELYDWLLKHKRENHR